MDSFRNGHHSVHGQPLDWLTKGDWLQALLFAVAVAVGLTPEMLPMIVTVNLAKGAIAMARKRMSKRGRSPGEG